MAELCGPVVAGLFLAVPAILPATLTLVAQQDGARAAGVEARGAALGSLGPIAFGLAIWLLVKPLAGALTLGIALVVWLGASLLLWAGGEKLGLR